MTPQERMIASSGPATEIILYPTGKRPIKLTGWFVCQRSYTTENSQQTRLLVVYLTSNGTIVVVRYIYQDKYTSLPYGKLIEFVGKTDKGSDGLSNMLMNGHQLMPIAEWRVFLASCDILGLYPCITID